jgi:transcriptional regulator GlxA family with amidase domain
MLEQKTATTCWWLSDWFKLRYPNVHLSPERLMAIDGRTWTAAAGSAYIHLGLRIVESFAGKELSTMTAKLLLVEPNRGTQAPYLSPGFTNLDRQGPLALLNTFVLNRIENPIRISELASTAHMSVRSLFRYFEKTKGISPLEFVQRMRIDRAKQLLEQTQEPVDSITAKCGYEDVSSFRKLFRNRVGMTPKEYRQRFGTIA